MKSTTTIEIEISDENKALIRFIVEQNWGVVKNEEGAPLEEMEDAIIRIRNSVSLYNAIGQIVPHLDSFFGIRGAEDAQKLKESLTTWGIKVSTTIEQ